jgi:hypothetical protein
MAYDEPLTVTFTTVELVVSQRPAPKEVQFREAGIRAPEWRHVAGETALVVLRYMAPASAQSGLEGSRVSIVQRQMVGYDGVAEALAPGVTFCNACGVHEAATG